MLGYFSLIGLLRLHSLLGDYYQALKVLENIDFNKKVMAILKTVVFSDRTTQTFSPRRLLSSPQSAGKY